MQHLYFIKILLILLSGLILSGCSQTKEVTEIKPRVIQPPVIQDTLPADFFDGMFQANKIVDKDTVESIKFIPDTSLLRKVKELYSQNKSLGIKLGRIGKFNFKMKPDSIVIWDTVKVSKPPDIIETPLLSKIGLVAIGIIIALIIISIFKGASWVK